MPHYGSALRAKAPTWRRPAVVEGQVAVARARAAVRAAARRCESGSGRGATWPPDNKRKADPASKTDAKRSEGAGLPEQERQAKAQRVREGMRARIREILTAEQQTKYDEFSGSEGGRGATAGRVWVIGPDGKPKAVAVRLGITDGTSTEVVSGDLHEGQEVITGAAGGANQPNRPSAPGGAPRLRL